MQSCDSATYFILKADETVESIVTKNCFHKKWGDNSKWSYNLESNTMRFYTKTSSSRFEVIMSNDLKRMYIVSEMIGIESGVQSTRLTIYERKH